MIDTNELRRLVQEATPGPWYIGSGIYEGRNIYSVEAVTDDEGFAYNPVVATAEDDEVACWDANARLIAAANPAVISELLDRLEAAEKERDALRAMLEDERKEHSYTLQAAKAEAKQVDALRAKIEQMERQEPVAEWTENRFHQYPQLVWNKKYRVNIGDKLYTLPGAKGE